VVDVFGLGTKFLHLVGVCVFFGVALPIFSSSSYCSFYFK
jgi:hypothetical protein